MKREEKKLSVNCITVTFNVVFFKDGSEGKRTARTSNNVKDGRTDHCSSTALEITDIDSADWQGNIQLANGPGLVWG